MINNKISNLKLFLFAGVLEEPLFKKSSVVSLYGSILYKLDGKVEGK
jgi:hypothetical protein